jgi:hypothetical protein
MLATGRSNRKKTKMQIKRFLVSTTRTRHEEVPDTLELSPSTHAAVTLRERSSHTRSATSEGGHVVDEWRGRANSLACRIHHRNLRLSHDRCKRDRLVSPSDGHGLTLMLRLNGFQLTTSHSAVCFAIRHNKRERVFVSVVRPDTDSRQRRILHPPI